MKFPFALYLPEPTATDVPIFVARNADAVAAAASLNIQTTPVPNQFVFALGHIAIRAVPGAGQTVSAAQLDIHDRATTPAVCMLFYDRPNPALGAALPWGRDDDRWTWLMPGHLLSLAVDFSAGGVANEARLAYSGWLIPRGNIQFGGF